MKTVAFAMLSTMSVLLAQDKPAKAITGQTDKDIPADYHKYFGQRINSWRDRERQIAKLDLDADLNQDGVLSNTDPADGGAFEATPPGLLLGEGEMTRMVIRLWPYRVDFDGEVVVTLEVEGINRSSRTGEFGSMEEELAKMGHVRVWRDTSKKQLLLDSRDPTKRVVEFATSYKTYPYNLPLTVPRFVFIEAVKTSPVHIGDIRLLCTVSHRSPETERMLADERARLSSGGDAQVDVAPEKQKVQKIGIKSFRTSFDHMLITVQKQPKRKEFINNNNEGAWIPPPGKKY